MCTSCGREVERVAGVCLSFDDRTIAEWSSLRPLLQKHNARVTFFITQFDSLSAEEVKLLRELASDGHEIGSHGARHVLAENFIKEYGYDEWLDLEVDPSIQSMRDAGFDPKSFAYPYGSKYWFTDYLLLKRFECTRDVVALNAAKDITLMDNIFVVRGASSKFSALGFDRNSALNRVMISNAMMRAKREKEVIFLYGHYPEKRDEPYSFDIEILKAILMAANENGLKFMTCTEVTGVQTNVRHD